jgi:hypothetical protein
MYGSQVKPDASRFCHLSQVLNVFLVGSSMRLHRGLRLLLVRRVVGKSSLCTKKKLTKNKKRDTNSADLIHDAPDKF